MPVQSSDCAALPSKFLDGEAVQSSLCNITNTPLTHYTVTCANQTVQVILCNIIASVYGPYDRWRFYEKDMELKNKEKNEKVVGYTQHSTFQERLNRETKYK